MKNSEAPEKPKPAKPARKEKTVPEQNPNPVETKKQHVKKKATKK